jgi:hypothetical protein
MDQHHIKRVVGLYQRLLFDQLWQLEHNADFQQHDDSQLQLERRSDHHCGPVWHHHRQQNGFFER